MTENQIFDWTEPFKPIQVQFTVRQGMTFTACLAPEEVIFLAKLEHNGSASCTHKERPQFESIELTDLVTKGIIAIEKRVADVFYKLTEIGRKLIEALQSPASPLSILELDSAIIKKQ